MFVFRQHDLPADPVFPADLEKLGYFINDRDQIRKISNPDAEFQYKINRNERWNTTQREAMNACIRKIVLERLQQAGLSITRLPLSANQYQAHVPILTSDNLDTATHITVVFGEPVQDLGIWAYRTIASESIEAGSAIPLAKAVLGDSQSQVGNALILANTGQLTWHCGSGRAVTQQTWLALPRSSAVAGQPTISFRNKIPSNADWQEHVDYVFENLLLRRLYSKRPAPRIDVIGVAEGGFGAFTYLKTHWEKWRPYISAICFADPTHSQYDLDEAEITNPTSFSAFLSSRCRAYVLSDKELGTQEGGYRHRACNCYSSGEPLNAECIMSKAWPHMLAWLDQLYYDPRYAEQVIIMASDVEPSTREKLEAIMQDQVDYVVTAEEKENVPVDEEEDEEFLGPPTCIADLGLKDIRGLRVAEVEPLEDEE